jgi:hypothetical protein
VELVTLGNGSMVPERSRSIVLEDCSFKTLLCVYVFGAVVILRIG